MRSTLRLEHGLLGAVSVYFNGAGNGVNFDASAAIAHVGAERVLALLFNHDRNLCADLAGHGGGRVEIHTISGAIEVNGAE